MIFKAYITNPFASLVVVTAQNFSLSRVYRLWIVCQVCFWVIAVDGGRIR